MKSRLRSTADNAPPLVRRVNFLWYALAIVPILGALYLSLKGTLPAMVAVFAFFALTFWFFSLCFAVWEKFIKNSGGKVDYRE